MAEFYKDPACSPAEEYVELDGDYPKAEDLDAAVAPDNYRKGYDGATDEVNATVAAEVEVEPEVAEV